MNLLNHTKILCASLRQTCLGTSVMDAEQTEQMLARTGAKKGKMRATKTILGDYVKPLKQLRAEARKRFNSVTLPGISPDLRITTPARLPDLQKMVKEYQEKDEALVATLEANYEKAKDQDKFDLQGAYDPTLYPDVGDLAKFFTIGLTITDMPKADYARIEGLTEVSRQALVDDHQKMLVRVADEARSAVQGQLCKLIQAVADKLSNPNAEKFHESTFDHLKDYLALVPDLNITNDSNLEALRKAASDRLSLSMRVIKDSAFLKEQAATAAKEILSQFGKLGGRKIIS